MGSAARNTRSGELINQVYELHELLESSKLCDTYRATDKQRSRVVKLKLLRPELALQSGAVQRFLHSPKTLFGGSHPNLSAVFAVDSDDTGIPFVVEEHVEGEPLARTIERFPSGMPLEAALGVIGPLVDALAFAHGRGLVHGRLDRTHVFVSAAGGSSVPKLTAPGAEQPSGPMPEARADLRALGSLLYELLSGRGPRKPYVALAKRTTGLPAGLCAIVDRCLSAEPVAAADVRAALDALRAPAPASEQPALAFAKTMLADRPSATAVIPREEETAVDHAAEPAGSPSRKPPAAVPAEQPAAGDGPVLVTMSDVAAAFGPIEGADRVGQAEIDPPATRSEKPAAREREHEAAAPRKPASPKQLRAGRVSEPRPVSAEQLRAIRERAEREERSYGRVLSALLFFLFVFLLVFAIPLLLDPEKARALLGPQVKLAVPGFALLSTFALVRTWAQEIHARPMMLRPVTLTLKVVVASIWLLGLGFFLPSGALATPQAGARIALGWGGAAFFFFLGIYGLMEQVREASANLVRSVLLALLYAGAFAGTYRTISLAILAQSGSRGVLAAAKLRADMHSLTAAAQGERGAADGGQPEMVERVEIGASEADDMRAIEEMNESRKARGAALENLGTTMEDRLE